MTTTATNHRPSSAAQRIAALLTAEFTQLRRNSTQLFYTVAMPPVMALALVGLDFIPKQSVGSFALLGVATMAMLFTIYYWVTTVLVTRREGRVLLRMLSGESRPSDIIMSIALPAFVLTLAQVALTAAFLAYRDVLPPLPAIPLALAGLLGGMIIYAALAVLTAAWTKTAESAQMSTMPMMLIVFVASGLLFPLHVLPETLTTVLSYTPFAATNELLSLGLSGGSILSTATPDSLTQAALQPLAVVIVWAVVTTVAALKLIRFNPRA